MTNPRCLYAQERRREWKIMGEATLIVRRKKAKSRESIVENELSSQSKGDGLIYKQS